MKYIQPAKWRCILMVSLTHPYPCIAVQTMFRCFAVVLLGLVAPSAAFTMGSTSELPTLTLDTRLVLEPVVAPRSMGEQMDPIDNSSNKPIGELHRMMLELSGPLSDRATLEEARNMIFDHIMTPHLELSAETPCCGEYPYCCHPKL